MSGCGEDRSKANSASELHRAPHSNSPRLRSTDRLIASPSRQLFQELGQQAIDDMGDLPKRGMGRMRDAEAFFSPKVAIGNAIDVIEIDDCIILAVYDGGWHIC